MGPALSWGCVGPGDTPGKSGPASWKLQGPSCPVAPLGAEESSKNCWAWNPRSPAGSPGAEPLPSALCAAQQRLLGCRVLTLGTGKRAPSRAPTDRSGLDGHQAPTASEVTRSYFVCTRGGEEGAPRRRWAAGWGLPGLTAHRDESGVQLSKASHSQAAACVCRIYTPPTLTVNLSLKCTLS